VDGEMKSVDEILYIIYVRCSFRRLWNSSSSGPRWSRCKLQNVDRETDKLASRPQNRNCRSLLFIWSMNLIVLLYSLNA